MKSLTCIVCPNGCEIEIHKENEEWVVTGNLCPKGREFAINEMTNPTRVICTTVKTIFDEYPRLSVKTDGEIPLNLIFQAMEEINNVVVKEKVENGHIILENVCNTGVNIISTSDMKYLLEGDFN